MQMEMYMKANGKMIKPRDKAFILMEMEQNTKACGKAINSTDSVKKYGPMVHNIKVIMFKEKSTELVNSNGLMGLYMREIFLTTIFMAKERINGVMEDSMKANGEKIECIIGEYLNGQMVDNILVSMSTIKKKAMVYFDGLEEEVIEATGEKENSMDLEFTLEMGLKEKANGKMGQELDGSMRRKLKIFNFLYQN